MAPNDSRSRFSGKLARRLRVGGLIAALSAGAFGAACAGGDDTDAGAGCLTTRQYFEQNVWSAFMGSKCAKCHTPDGIAVAENNAKFVLQPSSYPGFIDANLANIAEIAKIEYEGTTELLQKPLGKMNHGGGVQITAGGPEYIALMNLVARLGAPDKCADTSALSMAAVSTLTPGETLRKVALDLGGRLPTQEEVDSVEKGGDAALDEVVDHLMTEDTFRDRLGEIFNDVLLTDRFLRYSGAALDFMGADEWPAAQQFRDDQNPAYADRAQVNAAIAREPLNLVTYVVENDRPFTEILTANYALVNPYSARAYGLDLKWKDATDANEFQEAQLTEGNGTAIPSAGVLTSISFLNRWTTTPTNRNRGRARRVFKFFLATDILKIADRPIDQSSVTAEENPTLNSDACTVCHKVMDPVAGAFRGWDDDNYDEFNPDSKWHDDMFPPGFGGNDMDPGYYKKGLQWLAAELTKDPRFVISAVQTVYKGLTGHDPIPYPSDSSAGDFKLQLAAWEAQDDFFRKTGEAFAKANYNLKTVFKAVVKSAYYRGKSGSGADVRLRDIGTARILTPEMLNRKITAVTGIQWRKPWEWEKNHDWLREDYKLLYGGIDSEDVIARLTEPNGVMAAVASRMSNEVACRMTAYDFTKPIGERTLFPLVRPDEVPESAGNEVHGSVEDIKKNIQYLHERLLGEKLALDDEEITRTYQVFLDTWHELEKKGDDGIPWDCQGRWDPLTGEDLPDDQQLTRDENYTVRSWLAVVTYLLGDYKFLYE
jgi:hypothetical protein